MNSDTKKELPIASAVAAGVSLNELPEDSIAKIVSLTTPADACRLSCVSANFTSAADSDRVWGSFLPPDYRTILSTLSDPRFSKLCFRSTKQLFLYLSDSSILIDEGKKSLSLNKWSGKKIYMIAPRDLVIIWGDTPDYWEWISHPESRLEVAAKLNLVWWLEIRGRFSTSKLSRDTNYAAYLVFKMDDETFGFDYYPAEVSLALGGDKLCSKSVFLDQIIEGWSGFRHWFEPEVIDNSVMSSLQRPEKRADGWLEIELGEFFNNGEDELEMEVKEIKGGNAKGGLILQGIEIRPKEGSR